ncbi:unnamed protein product [Effrenium voratum]|nr:unnamed protein product [Effrenium voratum]
MERPPTPGLQALEVYAEWCRWLELEEIPQQLVLQRLRKGGEHFRSLLQFMARTGAPHATSGGELCAARRSQRAMQITCMVLTTNCLDRAQQSLTLAAACLELLWGLSKGFSLHICTVLQHLLVAHEPEVLTLLLHYQAPFVLLRALNRPGCSQLLQLLLGADATLPKVVRHVAMRPLRLHSLHQVAQYLLASQWAKYLETVLAHGARIACGCGDSPRTTTSTPPGTPEVHLKSPGGWSTGKAKVTPCSTPPRPQVRLDEASQPQLRTPEASQLRTPEAASRSPSLGERSPDPAERAGVDVILDFLSGVLHSFRFSTEAEKSRGQGWELAERGQIQHQLICDFFIKTSLVSSLCLLLSRAFQAASVLKGLLEQALRNRSCPDMAEALVGLCVQQLDVISSALGLASETTRRSKVPKPAGSLKRDVLRLNGYVVQQPLGALRVEVVQILAVLSLLAPDRVLPLVKPAVWSALVKWFFMYRCNHIFQATCGKLWVQVLRSGSPQLQDQIFVQLKLLQGLCHAILEDQRSATRRSPRLGTQEVSAPSFRSSRCWQNARRSAHHLQRGLRRAALRWGRRCCRRHQRFLTKRRRLRRTS